MTEQEWLTSDDPGRMLEFASRRWGAMGWHGISDRKLRLWCLAVQWLDPDRAGIGAKAMMAGLGYELADGLLGEEEFLRRLNEAVPNPPHGEPYRSLFPASRDAEGMVRGAADRGRTAEAATLFRDIVGNPFWPVALPKAKTRCPTCRFWDGYNEQCPTCSGSGEVDTVCTWLTPQVLSLAQTAYEDRPGRECEQCYGTGYDRRVMELPTLCPDCRGTGRVGDGGLDPLTLLALADALEEAGCPTEEAVLVKIRAGYSCPKCGDPGFWRAGQEFDHMKRCRRVGCDTVWIPETEDCLVERKQPATILTHLRSPGPHVRGCWALDLLLGKE